MTQILMSAEQAWTFARLPGVLETHHIPASVITHIGAHLGEEVDIYRQCGFSHIRLVEPDPRQLAVLYETFRDVPEVAVVAAAAVAKPDGGTGLLHYADRSVWSGMHPHSSADGRTVSVATVPIADLVVETNVLVLDAQGSELELLRAVDLTHNLDMVIVETSRRIGDTAAFYDITVSYMKKSGWKIAEEWVHDNSGYTDCVFIRKT